MTDERTPTQVDRDTRARIARATARGARVVGVIRRRDGLLSDVVLSDDPPGSTYGRCPTTDYAAPSRRLYAIDCQS